MGLYQNRSFKILTLSGFPVCASVIPSAVLLNCTFDTFLRNSNQLPLKHFFHVVGTFSFALGGHRQQNIMHLFQC